IDAYHAAVNAASCSDVTCFVPGNEGLRGVEGIGAVERLPGGCQRDVQVCLADDVAGDGTRGGPGCKERRKVEVVERDVTGNPPARRGPIDRQIADYPAQSCITRVEIDRHAIERPACAYFECRLQCVS